MRLMIGGDRNNRAPDLCQPPSRVVPPQTEKLHGVSAPSGTKCVKYISLVVVTQSEWPEGTRVVIPLAQLGQVEVSGG